MLEAIRSSSEIMSQLAGGNPPLHEAVRCASTFYSAGYVSSQATASAMDTIQTPAVCFVHEHAFDIDFPNVGRSGDTDRMSQLMREMHTAREADAASRRQVSCCPRVLRAFWTQVSWSLPTL